MRAGSSPWMPPVLVSRSATAAAGPSGARPRVRLGPLLRSTHPEPVVAVTVVATALAASAGRSRAGCLAVASAALAGQLSVGWCNDYVDRERDALAGRTDKPVAQGEVPAGAAAVAAGAALAACVPLSLLSGRRAAGAHFTAVALAWGYDLGIKGTAASIVPYAGAFGLLPCFVVLGLPGAPRPTWWAVLAAALLGSGAHFANALPDLVDDLAAGVRGLPHRVGGPRSRAIAAAAMTASSLVLTFGPGRPERLALAGSAAAVLLGITGATTGADAWARPDWARLGWTRLGWAGQGLAGSTPESRPESRLPFRATLGVALLDVGLLVARGPALVVPRDGCSSSPPGR